ncbi:MAG: hypothetical protein IPJ47_09985 [Anaerolineales bacterium]|nr:hypothetical protein [Anaerolineales bacterium]
MDFVKLVQSADDAIYEVMAWIMMVPKSLFHIVFQPKRSIAYVKAEMEKKPDERFDEYLSPVILWFLVGPLQNTVFNILVKEPIISMQI